VDVLDRRALAIGLLALASVSGCGGKPAVAPKQNPAAWPTVRDAYPAFAVSLSGYPNAVQLERRVPPEPQRDAVYALVGPSGYLGSVRVTADPGIDNDDGPQYHRVAVRLESSPKPIPADTFVVAIGPLAQPVSKAQIVERAPDELDHAGREWVRTLAVDLDGDGAIDFEERSRCGAYEGESWCTEVCYAWGVGEGKAWVERARSCGSNLMGG
jgi:hypothetical protein